MAKLECVHHRIFERPFSGRCRENQIAIQGGVAGQQGAGHAVMGGGCHPLGLRLGQVCIAGDNGDGGGLSHPFARQGGIGAGE